MDIAYNGNFLFEWEKTKNCYLYSCELLFIVFPILAHFLRFGIQIIF